MSIKFLVLIGSAILGVAFALLATYAEYKAMIESISIIGSVVSLILAAYSFLKEK